MLSVATLLLSVATLLAIAALLLAVDRLAVGRRRLSTHLALVDCSFDVGVVQADHTAVSEWGRLAALERDPRLVGARLEERRRLPKRVESRRAAGANLHGALLSRDRQLLAEPLCHVVPTEHLLLPRDDGVVVTKHATRTIPGEDAPRTLNGLTAKAAARAVACLAAAVACLAILPLLGLAIALSLTVLLLWRLTVLLLWRLTVLLLAVAWLDLLLTITLLLSVSLLRLTILHLHGGSRCHTCWPHERCCGHRRGDGHRRGCDRGRER